MTTRLSTKGQIILPKEIRLLHAWGPGTEFNVEDTREGLLLRPIRPKPSSTLDEVAGCLSFRRRAKSLAQMQTAIDKEVARRHESGRY